MTVVLFIFILLMLVVGHEFGHFVVAKLSGMKVPEFGIGFPPKLWGRKIGNTEYTVNALPFGGFVKIVGEDISDETQSDPAAFSNRPKYAQALTLLAGPLSNIFIAFLLSTLAFMVGVPAATNSGYDARQISAAHVLILEVMPGSPAESAGLHTGDEVVALVVNGQMHTVLTPQEIPVLMAQVQGPVTLSLVRNHQPLSISVSPQKGMIGIATAAVGTLHLGLFQAVVAGFRETVDTVWSVLAGLLSLIGHAFTFSANFSQVAGPVGIAHLVGDAATFGFGSVLSFAALISINLGVINLFPFPALDGGRLAFVIAEAIVRRPVPAKVANFLNTAGFALLILLMVAITAHDVIHLVS